MANPWEVQYDSAVAGNPWEGFQEKKPVTYSPTEGDGKDSIFIEDTGETIEADAGIGDTISLVQNQGYDAPATVGEETAANFDKMMANMALVFAANDLISDEQASVFIADRSSAIADVQKRQPEYMKQFNEQWEGSGVFGKAAAVFSNPLAIGRQIVSQSPHAIVPLMSTWVGTKAGAATGATGAAIAGQLGPQVATPEEIVTVPIAAAVGGVAGGAAGAYQGTKMSGTAETLDEIMNQEYNVDMTDAESVLNILSNKDAMKNIHARAEQAGADMAKVDALFQVFGGFFLKRLAKGAGGVKKVAAATADVTTQAAGESLGEATRQYSAFEKVNWDEALLEGVTSLGQSAGQTAIATTTKVATDVTKNVKSMNSYLDKIAIIESNNDPLAQNPNSTAKGRYQFLDGTGAEFGLDKFEFGTPEYTRAEERAVRQLTKRNARGLKKILGRDATDGELYLAHQQGLGGARKLLKDGDALAVDVVGADAVKLNGGDANMTAQEFANKWISKVDGEGVATPAQAERIAPEYTYEEIEAMTPEERVAVAQEYEISDLERDAISVDMENQVIASEKREQEQFIAEAENIKESISDTAIDVADDVAIAKKLGYKPKGISQYIKEKGGIRDNDGELANRGITSKTLVGLVRKSLKKDDGQSSLIDDGDGIDKIGIEEIKQSVFEAGYFPDKQSSDEITDSELYDAIAQDVQGERVYTFEDQDAIDEIAQFNDSGEAEAALSNRGIDLNMSVEEIANVLRAESGLGDYIESKPITSRLENNERMRNRIKEITTVVEDNDGLMSGNIMSRALEGLSSNKFIQDVSLGFGKALVPISTRIKNISPKLFARLRKYEFDVKEMTMRDVEASTPFLRKFRSLDDETQLALDLALKNGDTELVDFIGSEYGMTDEIKAMQTVLDDIHTRATDAGVDVDYRKNYFPRRVKDVDGLIDYFKKGQYWNTVEKAFKNWSDANVPLTEEAKAELKKYRSQVTQDIKDGETRALTQAERDQVSKLYFEKKAKLPRRALSKEEKAKIINSLVRGFSVGGVSISRSGSLKKGRKIESVSADINKFYENSEKTLLGYISSVNETIETSRLFGKGRIVEGEQLNIEDSIGAFIEDAVANEDISNRQTEILQDIFNARFNTGKMGWVVGSIRDLTYVDTMGSPLNAVTQFGDLATSMYNAGIFNTLRTVGAATFDKTQINLRDLTIENITQEFDNNNATSKIVDTVFRATGLNKMDRIGKLTLVNSTLKKMQKKAKKNDAKLLSDLQIYFEQDAGQVLQDLKDNKITDDVKFLLANTLMDFQPVARSEMPQYYLSSGNMKILYMLKSFTIKQLDVYRREVFTNLNTAAKTGDVKLAATAMTNFVRLAGFWIMMGASADYMKDMLRSMLGDDEMDEPEDYVYDNIFKAFGWSRFQNDMIGRQGVTDTLFDLVKPPTKVLDNLEKDWKTVKKDGLTPENSKSIRSIPVGGELYYFWFGAGSGGGGGSRGSNGRRTDL